MNVKLITGFIFVLIILGGLGLFFMNDQNTKQLAERISPTGTNETASADTAMPGMTAVTSSDHRVTFHYPTSWHLTDTTGNAGKGEFGVIQQAWVLQSFTTDDAGKDGIPDNSAKIDIEIQKGGQNLPIEALVDCNGKTITCEKIGIDSQQFIKSDATLNTGMKAITVATFYDDKILRLSALVAPGDQQDTFTQTVSEIFDSITFSDLPQS